jgi:hypothetical protein
MELQMTTENNTDATNESSVSTENVFKSIDYSLSASFLGIFSIMTSLFGLGIVLGPWAIQKSFDARKFNPENRAIDGIAMGALGTILSLCTLVYMVMESIKNGLNF